MDNFNELEMEKVVEKITLESNTKEILILDEHSRKITIIESK